MCWGMGGGNVRNMMAWEGLSDKVTSGDKVTDTQEGKEPAL